MDFGQLLSRSWQIVWQHKFLFLLGFLAGLGSGGGGGNSGSSFDSSSFGTGSGGDFAGQAETFFANYGALLLGGACLLLLLGIALWLLRLTAQGGLIASVVDIEAGQTVTFGQAFSAGASKLGRLVGLNVVMYGPFTLLGIITGLVFLGTAGTAIFTEASGGSAAEVEAILGSLGLLAVCFGCLGCLVLPLVLLVNVVYPFAQRGLVVQEMGVMDSIRHGWQIVRTHTSDVILLVLLFVVLGFLFTFALALVLIPFGLLFFAPALFSLIQDQSINAFNIFWLIGAGICTGLLGAALNSILLTFRSTAVTLAYQEFTAKPAPDMMTGPDLL